MPDLFREKATQTAQTSSLDPANAANQAAPAGIDRTIDAYDRKTDTYYDRGRIIADKDLEKYLQRRRENNSGLALTNNSKNKQRSLLIERPQMANDRPIWKWGEKRDRRNHVDRWKFGARAKRKLN